MKALHQSWLIATKDLRIFLKDRFAVVMAVAFPIMFIVLFTFLFKGVSSGDQPLELLVASEEPSGGLSYQIIDRLIRMKEAKITAMTHQEALDAVNNKKIVGFLEFPHDFGQAVYSGKETELKVIASANSPSTQMALLALGRGIAGEIGAASVTINSAIALQMEQGTPGGTADPGKIQQLVSSMLSGSGQSAPQVTFDIQKVGPMKEPPSSNWVVPGYLVMFVFFTSALSAEAIVAEKETQTLERLLAGGTKRASILGGKFLSSFLRGSAQVVLLWLAGIFLFNVDVGPSPAAVIVISVLTVIMASAFGVMLASMVRRRRAAGALATTLSIGLAPIGGCWWPLFITPAWMQSIARITPHAWATTGFNKLLVFGAGFQDVLPEMLALVVFAAAFSIIALLRFRPEAA